MGPLFFFFGSANLIAPNQKYPHTFSNYAYSKAIPKNGFYAVERVISGDILKLTNGEKVRLIGIDIPESKSDVERTGQDIEVIKAIQQEAKKYLSRYIKKLSNQEVYLEFDLEKRDRYSKSGRLLAYVFWDTGHRKGEPHDVIVGTNQYFGYFDNKYMHFINATMVKKGYATTMAIPPNLKHEKMFEKLYREAREQKRGLWVNQKPVKRKKEFYADGTLKLDMIIYNEENFEGFWREYYENSSLKIDARLFKFDDGCSNEGGIPIEGVAREYHENGKLKSVGFYKKNCEEGAHNYYSSAGLLEQKLYFEQGEHLWTKWYGEDGETNREDYYNKD